MDSNHELLSTQDGSFTCFSKEYGQSYHSVKEGAFSETLHKHVIPAFRHHETKDEIVVLDICFGLGLNTLTTIWYNKTHGNKKLKIYSPELDSELIRKLTTLPYPEELHSLKPLLEQLTKNHYYEDDRLRIELFIGDAREYIRRFENFFDVVYQDAFSPQVNPLLWTREYFEDISRAIKKDGVLTSYSIALPIRLGLSENGFYVYVQKEKDAHKSTLASLKKLTGYEKVDIEHKLALNPEVKSLRDKNYR